MIHHRVWAGCCLMVLLPAALAAQSFTLQQVMSAPFQSELRASPVGERFVWLADQEGRRNLWIAEVGSNGAYAARALTHYDADDGIEIGDVTWTPDGQSVVYVRGGDFEFPEKPAPNPDLLPQGVEQDIWVVPAKGGEPRKIAVGWNPEVSPDGATLTYLLKDQVWTIKLSDPAAKPEQLWHERGKPDSLTWSPDGKSLAFVSQRGDHAFIGVYSFTSQALRYLAPSTEKDSEPAWSPDGRDIAFVRQPSDVSGIDFKPRRAGQPWSIQVADVSTGQAREVWRAKTGPGSVFHEADTDHQLLWLAGNRIIFPWEGDGWIHLYSIDAADGTPTPLTPGEFEVQSVALARDGKTVYFTSNQGDIDRRHLWQVGVNGGEARQIIHGEGIEVAPVVAADGTVALLHSDARIPMRPAILAANGELRDVAPQLIPAEFPAAKLIVPQQVIFTSADGLQIHGQLFLPAFSRAGQKYPAVVFFHGGSRRQMLLGWHYMQYYSNSYAMNQYLASLGYIVLSVNYRSGIGYGLNFREALNYGAAGASEFNDVLGAGLYLRGRSDVDGTHIGVWGGSYGGYLTALALARASDLFAAGVDMHGVHDWNLELSIWQPAYDPNTDQQAARIAWESSPLASVKGWRSPVLLMQGDDDRNVQFSQTVRLAAALRAQGTPFEEHVFPDEIHDFLLHRTWLAAYQYAADFFGRYLKPAK
ncbi:MAG TPA: prolyl oligopeptidase family serine peptidase [Silvibacterium sp.]|nr:prolyl oligopeptidase family serine peptidase [Silvibacterium sp.]